MTNEIKDSGGARTESDAERVKAFLAERASFSESMAHNYGNSSSIRDAAVADAQLYNAALRLLSERDSALTAAEGEIRRLRVAERALSDAYVRLRALIPGAFDTPHAPSPEQVWSTTELALKAVIEKCDQGPSAISRPRPDGEQPQAEQPRWRRPGFDVGAGTVKEGDTAMFEGRKCKVLTVYHDGDVQIEVPTYPTVKWRFVTPLPATVAAAEDAGEVTDAHDAATCNNPSCAQHYMADDVGNLVEGAPSADTDAMEIVRDLLVERRHCPNSTIATCDYPDCRDSMCEFWKVGDAVAAALLQERTAAEALALRWARAEIIALCEAVENHWAVSDVATTDLETKAGAFARGRIHEAKSIRKAIGEVFGERIHALASPATVSDKTEGERTDG